MDLEKELPCTIDKDEDSLLAHIKNVDYAKASEATRYFHEKYAPYAGHACDRVIDVLLKRLNYYQRSQNYRAVSFPFLFN